jgi:hypothetical protein
MLVLPWTAESQYLVVPGVETMFAELVEDARILSWNALSGDASKELGLEDV